MIYRIDIFKLIEDLLHNKVLKSIKFENFAIYVEFEDEMENKSKKEQQNKGNN